jgi:hypothetical protein
MQCCESVLLSGVLIVAAFTHDQDDGSVFDQISAKALFDDPLSGVNAWESQHAVDEGRR